jgi:hypothetical protein
MLVQGAVLIPSTPFASSFSRHSTTADMGSGSVLVESSADAVGREAVRGLVPADRSHEPQARYGCTFSTMNSTVLGLGSLGCDCCPVRIFLQKVALEHVIGSHACSFEALACV